MLGGDVAK